ncbi:unnamed protein product [Paramecium primaurelia]|uniref:Uncharacterized protein n=1 Tax=Paramecium primaurelia TaxID=5886 RepID=A0A8S1PAJ3_PARPR|nr:unnamed protein product [Paramecium primaurelia]
MTLNQKYLNQLTQYVEITIEYNFNLKLMIKNSRLTFKLLSRYTKMESFNYSQLINKSQNKLIRNIILKQLRKFIINFL